MGLLMGAGSPTPSFNGHTARWKKSGCRPRGPFPGPFHCLCAGGLELVESLVLFCLPCQILLLLGLGDGWGGQIGVPTSIFGVPASLLEYSHTLFYDTVHEYSVVICILTRRSAPHHLCVLSVGPGTVSQNAALSASRRRASFNFHLSQPSSRCWSRYQVAKSRQRARCRFDGS